MPFSQYPTGKRFLCYSSLLICLALLSGLTARRWPAFAQSLTVQSPVQPAKTGTLQMRTSGADATQQTIVPLVSGTPRNGTASGGSQGACALSSTQYSIQTTAQARRLQIGITGTQDVDLYVRFNSPVASQGGQLQFDYNSDSAATEEDVTVTPNILPALQTGTYYIGVVNCSASTTNFTLTATVTNSGSGQLTEELKLDDNSPESPVLIGNGGIYINRLTPLQYPSRLRQLRINFRAVQGQPNPSGAQIRLLAFNVASGAALPDNPAFLVNRVVTLPTISSARFFDFPIGEEPEITEGDWCVGFQAPVPASGVSLALDVSSTRQDRSFFANPNQAFQAVTGGNGLIRAVVLSGTAAVANVSAASFSAAALAANSIVAAFGARLATNTASATTQPLPTTLAGTTVKVRDSTGTTRDAPLFFVSFGQVNYLLPEGTANGNAVVVVTSSDNTVSTGTVNIVSLAPGLIAANANGQGVAAGFALRVKADNSQALEPLARFEASQNRFVAVPVDVSDANEQVFLILFGTGFRSVSQLADVTVRIGGQNAEVTFAGAQGSLAGLDQLNVRLASALAGRGEVDVALTVSGRNANVVRVNVK